MRAGNTIIQLLILSLTIGTASFCYSNDRKAGPRTLNLAVIQTVSTNGEIQRNLDRAEHWLEQAVTAGAEFVLFPEFMPTGYELTDNIFQAAESMDGLTVRWLQRLSATHQIWLGTSFLELDEGEHYNSFVLVNPEGEIAGKVRKEVPASMEVYFFKGEVNPHYIDTDIGRVGIIICYETYLSRIANKIVAANVDLLLMPFSFPYASGGQGPQPLSGEIYAGVYNRALGVPVAAVNKVGAWRTEIKGMQGIIANGYFPGLSAIADSDGSIEKVLDDKEGFIVTQVELNPKYKKSDYRFEGEYVADLISIGSEN